MPGEADRDRTGLSLRAARHVRRCGAWSEKLSDTDEGEFFLAIATLSWPASALQPAKPGQIPVHLDSQACFIQATSPTGGYAHHRR